MNQPAWVSVSFVVVALVAIGLALAALIIALDEDDPVVFGLDAASLSALLDDGTPAPALAERPAPIDLPASAPAATAASLVERRVTLGLILVGLDDDLTVRALLPGGPAQQAGIEIGDRILTVNGADVDSRVDIVAALDGLDVGDVAVLVVERDGATLSIDLTLSPPDLTDFAPRRGDPGASTPPVLGLQVQSGDDGLTVRAVQPRSAAAEAGVQEGDLLREIDGDPIPDRDAVHDALAPHQPGDTIILTVERDGESLSLDVVLGEGRTARSQGVRPPTSPGTPQRDGSRAPFDRFRDLFQGFFDGPFDGEGGRFDLPDGLLPDRLDVGELQIVRGEVSAISVDSITLGDGAPIAIDAGTRQPAGQAVAPGDSVLVIATDGVARAIVAAPAFLRPGSARNEA